MPQYGVKDKADDGSYSLLDNSTLASLCVDSCSSSLQSVRQSIQQGCTASTDTVDHDGDTYPGSNEAHLASRPS